MTPVRLEIVDAHDGERLEPLRAMATGYALTWAEPDGSLQERDVAMLARLPRPYVPPEGASLLALHDGAPVGCAFLQQHAGPVQEAVEIKHLFVPDTWRRRGIGRALLDVTVARCRQRGATRLLLDVDAGRSPAIALYEAYGFRRTDAFNAGWPGARWYALFL